MSAARGELRTWLGLAAVLLSACSLLIGFDPEGQPCDANGQCLDGYGCSDGRCRRGTSPCGQCPSGFACQNETCVPETCAVQKCPVGRVCSDEAGFPACRALAEPELGHPCLTQAECGALGPDRLCYFGAISLSTGSPRPGVCLERCPQDGGTPCATAGATCQTLSMGRDAGGGVQLCVTPGLLNPCRVDSDCGGEAPTCTAFDHPSQGPITVCDKPLSPAAAVGEACAQDPSSGALCANGLCVPPDPSAGQTATCGQLCDTGTCTADATCALVEHQIVGVFRHLPLCLTQPSWCEACLNDSDCRPDAPHCSSVPDGGSASWCLPSCTPTVGEAACPPSTQCVALDADAGFRCLPIAGGC